MSVAAFGSLEDGGIPHVSYVTIVPQGDGTAILLLSDLARHTANIKRDARASLLVMANQTLKDGPATGSNEDPLVEVSVLIKG